MNTALSGRLLHCSEVSAHGIVFVGGGDAGVVVDALQGLIIQEIGEFRIGPDKGGQGQDQQRGRQCGEEHGQTVQQDGLHEKPAEKAQVHDEQLPLVAFHHVLAGGDAVHDPHLRVIQEKIQALPVPVGGDEAGDDEQQAPQEHEHIGDDLIADDPQQDRQPVQQIAEAALSVPDGADDEDNHAGADHQRHDLQQQIDAPGAHARLGGHDPAEQFLVVFRVVVVFQQQGLDFGCIGDAALEQGQNLKHGGSCQNHHPGAGSGSGEEAPGGKFQLFPVDHFDGLPYRIVIKCSIARRAGKLKRRARKRKM